MVLKQLLKQFWEFCLTFVFSFGNTALLFFRDHNGKPSATRLIITIITYKVLKWGDHIVYNEHLIPTNLVFLVAICIVGVAFFMRKISSEQFTDLFKSVFMNIKRTSSGYSSFSLSPEEQADVDEALEGPQV